MFIFRGEEEVIDKDIIKALEDIRYHLTASKHKQVIDDAIDLINILQAENENYSHNNQKLVVENLQMIKSIKHLKADAIKEFAERLKEETNRVYYVESIALLNVHEIINNLVKEMVGEE